MKSILVASDNAELAERIKVALGSECGQVNISCDPEKYSMDLLKFKPDVLFLGFSAINLAQDYLCSVNKMSQFFNKAPYTSVLLYTQTDYHVATAMDDMRSVDFILWYAPDAMAALAMPAIQVVNQHDSILQSKIELYKSTATESVSPASQLIEQIAASSNTKSKPIILLVDDDPFIHTLTSKQIDSEHYELMFAHDGEQALDMLANTKPDLIFMDVQMPKMTGVEVTRRIKEMPQTKAVPVVMLTGISDRDVVVSCMAAGAADFLEKPFNKVKLNSKIESVLLK